MLRRDLASALIVSSAAAVVLSDRSEAQTCTPPCIPRTQAETTAGVTPVNYSYFPGDVRRYGATGDGVTDDTVAIQNGIKAVRADTNGILFFPPVKPSEYYKITSTLTITGPITIRGSGPNSTVIIGVGFSTGQYLLDFNCLASDVVQYIEISSLTLRSLDSVPSGVHLKNASYVTMMNVDLYGLASGVVLEGTRCFSNTFYNVAGYQITLSTFSFVPGFSGGGQFLFVGCTLTGNIGLSLTTGSAIDNLSLQGCNFEQCVSLSMYITGTCAGLSVVGSRTEGCNSSDFEFRPFGATEYVDGVLIAGCVFGASDSGGSDRILLGGDSGKIRGFSISGNIVTHGTDSFSANLVQLNGDGESGAIFGNSIRGTTGGVVNTKRNGVVVYSNENLTGKLAEAWGAVAWGVLQGSSTYDPPSLATDTGATTTVAVAGAALGDLVSASFSNDLQGITVTAWVSAANTASVRFQNGTGGTLNLASGTLKARVFKS